MFYSKCSIIKNVSLINVRGNQYYIWSLKIIFFSHVFINPINKISSVCKCDWWLTDLTGDCREKKLIFWGRNIIGLANESLRAAVKGSEEKKNKRSRFCCVAISNSMTSTYQFLRVLIVRNYGWMLILRVGAVRKVSFYWDQFFSIFYWQFHLINLFSWSHLFHFYFL